MAKARYKIFILITQSSWGGAQRYVYDLATNLPPDFDVTVGCGDKGILIDRLIEKNIKVKVFKNLLREISPFKDLRALMEISDFLKKERFDLIHTNSTKAEIIGNLAGFITKTPVIFTAHGFILNEPLSWPKKIFYLLLERIANINTKALICVSNYDLQTANRYKIGNPKALKVIHNGIAPSSKTIDPRKALKPVHEVITVANLYPNKGLPFLIEAAKIVESRFPKVTFRIIGDGPEATTLQELVKTLDLKNVSFEGFQDNPFDFLDNSKIFTLPSTKEGFPYTILEAMDRGMPIIATNVGGISEAIKHSQNGLVVPSGDSKALAQALCKLLSKAALRLHFSKTAKIDLNRNFTLQKMVSRTERIYLAVAASNPQPQLR